MTRILRTVYTHSLFLSNLCRKQLWSHLKNYVRKKPCHTVNAVRRRVYKFFHYKITPQLLQNLFNHFKKVLDEIIQRNGDWTDM